MGQAIGQVLSLGVGVALSPIPIIGVILMLGTPRARSNAPAFLAGWIGGLAVAGTIVLLISGAANTSDGGQPADWLNILRLVLGLVLLRVALRRYRARPRPGEEPELPHWMKSIDRFTGWRAAAFGVTLSALNPKNLIFTIAAASAIAQTEVAAGKQAIALAVFVALGTLGTATPVAFYFASQERSRKALDELKDWMVRNNATIIAVICLLVGAKLIGDAISGF